MEQYNTVEIWNPETFKNRMFFTRFSNGDISLDCFRYKEENYVSMQLPNLAKFRMPI